jgi:hypothetical protein
MKATKEEIIAIAKKIAEQCLRTKFVEKSIDVEEKKVTLSPVGNKGYYEHDGWMLSADDLSFPEDGFIIYFLKDGTPIRVGFAFSQGSSTSKYIIKNSDGNYKILINKEDYFNHHNFDFTKKEFKFVKIN